MEKKQKTYQSTNAVQLDTYVLVKGKKVLIEFRGGTLDPRWNGTYQTTDPEVIKQLDADIARVGADKASFKCIHEETLLNDEPVETGEPVTTKEIPDVKTVTAAKEWLLDASEAGIIKRGITSSVIKNRTDVLRIAAENGVTFIDLPKE